MTQHHRPTVNLLLLNDEPTVGGAVAKPLVLADGGRSLSQALTQLGWQVHLFTSSHAPEAQTAVWFEPDCHLTLLEDPHAPAQLASVMATVQRQTGLVWPLLHTFGAGALAVGAHLQHEQGWRWLHSPESFATIDKLKADQIIAFTPQAVSTVNLPTDELSQLRYNQHRLTPGVMMVDWAAIARYLDILYRRHLAIHVGAIGLSLPAQVTLPLPTEVRESPRVPHFVAQSA